MDSSSLTDAIDLSNDTDIIGTAYFIGRYLLQAVSTHAIFTCQDLNIPNSDTTAGKGNQPRLAAKRSSGWATRTKHSTPIQRKHESRSSAIPYYGVEMKRVSCKKSNPIEIHALYAHGSWPITKAYSLTRLFKIFCAIDFLALLSQHFLLGCLVVVDLPVNTLFCKAHLEIISVCGTAIGANQVQVQV